MLAALAKLRERVNPEEATWIRTIADDEDSISWDFAATTHEVGAGLVHSHYNVRSPEGESLDPEQQAVESPAPSKHLFEELRRKIVVVENEPRSTAREKAGQQDQNIWGVARDHGGERRLFPQPAEDLSHPTERKKILARVAEDATSRGRRLVAQDPYAVERDLSLRSACSGGANNRDVVAGVRERLSFGTDPAIVRVGLVLEQDEEPLAYRVPPYGRCSGSATIVRAGQTDSS
jgi:hypothetical protein